MPKIMPYVNAFAVLMYSLCTIGNVAHAQDSTLNLPVRVHLLRSKESDALTTTRSESDVEMLFSTANAIWAQAGIVWRVESIVREESPAGALFDSLLAGQLMATRPNQLAIIPRKELLSPGWNLFLLRDFGQIAGGVFYSDISSVVLGERGMGIDLLPDGRGGATLAHELGHSLGLEHQPCDSTRNILALGCWSPTAHMSLTAGQIATARRQALLGRPTTVDPRTTGRLR